MTHLNLNLPILEKPYHTPGRQLCQLLILIRHPVWAFPHKLLEAVERERMSLRCSSTFSALSRSVINSINFYILAPHSQQKIAAHWKKCSHSPAGKLVPGLCLSVDNCHVLGKLHKHWITSKHTMCFYSFNYYKKKKFQCRNKIICNIFRLWCWTMLSWNNVITSITKHLFLLVLAPFFVTITNNYMFKVSVVSFVSVHYENRDHKLKLGHLLVNITPVLVVNQWVVICSKRAKMCKNNVALRAFRKTMPCLTLKTPYEKKFK